MASLAKSVSSLLLPACPHGPLQPPLPRYCRLLQLSGGDAGPLVGPPNGRGSVTTSPAEGDAETREEDGAAVDALALLRYGMHGMMLGCTCMLTLVGAGMDGLRTPGPAAAVAPAGWWGPPWAWAPPPLMLMPPWDSRPPLLP